MGPAKNWNDSGFIPETGKQISIIIYRNGVKNRNCMLILTNAEKGFRGRIPQQNKGDIKQACHTGNMLNGEDTERVPFK